jgi:hypothetical protein
LVSGAGKQVAGEEETAPKSSDSYTVGFNTVIVPFFLAINQLDMS